MATLGPFFSPTKKLLNRSIYIHTYFVKLGTLQNTCSTINATLVLIIIFFKKRKRNMFVEKLLKMIVCFNRNSIFFKKIKNQKIFRKFGLLTLK